MKRFAEKFRRLTEMGLPEVYFRAKQQVRITRERLQLQITGSATSACKWWEAWDPERVSDEALRSAIKNGRGQDANAFLPKYLASRSNAAFFWNPGEPKKIVSLYSQRFPGRAAQICAEADSSLAHRFRIFAFPEVSAQGAIPWRRDLVNGRESNLDHFSQIRYLDFDSVGDSKVVWELSRHMFLIGVCLAFLLTRDKKYSAAVFDELSCWHAENPYGRGINWASSLEVAFRSWSWLWIAFMLGADDDLASNGLQVGNISAALSRNAEFISANLSTYFSPNTHLMGEGFVLFCTGLLFPELKGSQKWLDEGRRILEEEMLKQVRE